MHGTDKTTGRQCRTAGKFQLLSGSRQCLKSCMTSIPDRVDGLVKAAGKCCHCIGKHTRQILLFKTVCLNSFFRPRVWVYIDVMSGSGRAVCVRTEGLL
jgi:hypothetical protein